ncbi:SPOR domain-containing protein [Anabaena sp. CA = ATCC 33047]|uniref:SPOR domain-containing protein n=1 Tax=Anabaena sp. (strain CA / ATCC 33047) TaxID=52271 RepID=UPI0008337D5D|nr:SPOR domain-containing protein [Anabaena sp. CA = ATCC 33047]
MTRNINYQDSICKNLKLVNREILNYSWVIVRLLPDMQRVTVASFRSRSYAETYLRSLRQLFPDAYFVVVFDCEYEEAVI